MKKNILSAMLLIIALFAFALTADAQTHRAYPLLSGSGMTVFDNNTTNLVAANQRPVYLWVNPDGSTPNINLLLTGIGTNAAASNAVRIALQTTADGTNWHTVGGTNSYALTLTGTTRATQSTNITSQFNWVGVKQIRATSLITDDQPGNATGMSFQAYITGFVP